MTPERAREFLESLDWVEPTDYLVEDVLAACAEERRGALAEAAEACRIQRIPNKSPASEIEAYNEGCYDCGTAIERLRDKSAPHLGKFGPQVNRPRRDDDTMNIGEMKRIGIWRRNLARHSVLRAIYDAVQAIEACGASTALTHAVTVTGDLSEQAAIILDEIDELRAALAAAAEREKRLRDELRKLIELRAEAARADKPAPA